MPKISEARREERRDQILDAALTCFTERGFQATSMSDIIAASGLSAGAIYLYFDGKWSIAMAVAQRAVGERVLIAITSGAAGRPTSPADVIRSLGHGIDTSGVSPRLIVQAWGEAAIDEGFGEIIRGVFAQLDRVFGNVLRDWARETRDMREQEAEAWAHDLVPAMLALGQGYLLQRSLLPDFDEARYLAGVERLLVP